MSPRSVSSTARRGWWGWSSNGWCTTPPSPPPRWIPRCCARRSGRTPRPRSIRAPRPARCRAVARSPSNPVARWSWPARRWPPSAPWSAPSPRTPRCSTIASPPTASPSPRTPRTRCAPPAGCSTFPATARWNAASTGSARGAAAACAPPPPCRCASMRGRAAEVAAAGMPCTRWARCWSGRSRTRRCCTGGAPGGSRRGSARGSTLDPAAHRPAAVRCGAIRRPRGPGGCSTPSCCASGAPTAGGTRRPASRSRPGSAGSAELPPPTTADLDYHISTLFPPVRPHGHLEVRYLDAQPGRRWALPAAVLAALLSDPAVTDRARQACEPTRRPLGVGRPPRAGGPGAAARGGHGVRAGRGHAAPAGRHRRGWSLIWP